METTRRNYRIRPGVRGVTLVECLVIVGIIAVLGSLLIGPGMRVIKKNVAATTCASNLRQIGVAFQLFAGENNGQLPGITSDPTGDADAQDGKGMQWDQQLRTYLDIRDNTTKSPLKKTAYYCPASEPDPGYAGKAVTLLSYTYNVNVGRTATSPGIRSGSAPDASSIMLLADLELATSTDLKSYVPQTGQGKNNTIIFRPSSTYYKFLAARHSQRMNILFLDGHVAPRMRVDENSKSSPPEEVRWTSGGELTGSR